MTEEKQTKRFEPKVPVQLDPPKDDPISQEELAKCDGMALPQETLPANPNSYDQCRQFNVS